MVNIVPLKNIEEIEKYTLNYFSVGQKVALSGGSTYKKIASYWKSNLKSDNILFFPVDERKVSIDNENSNWGVFKNIFFNDSKYKNSVGNFAKTKEQYDDLLKKYFKEIPEFDLTFLGMGDDGHIASLFPEKKYDDNDIVIETISPKKPFERITLNYRIILNSKKIILIIFGDNKKELFQKITTQKTDLPITKIISQAKDLDIIIPKDYLL